MLAKRWPQQPLGEAEHRTEERESVLTDGLDLSTVPESESESEIVSDEMHSATTMPVELPDGP